MFCNEGQMQVSEITNEKNEKTWDDVPDVSPAAVRIPRQFDLINEITIIIDVIRTIDVFEINFFSPSTITITSRLLLLLVALAVVLLLTVRDDPDDKFSTPLDS